MAENPLAEARHRLGLTQEELARAAGVQRLTVLRTEQGLYARPSTKLLAYFQRRLPVASSSDLEKQYTTWVRDKRSRSSPFGRDGFYHTIKWVWDPNKGLHPLAALRQANGLSQMGLCVALCVNSGPIHKWEAWKQRNMPEQLREALRDAGYSDYDIEFLDVLAAREYDRRQGER